MIDIVNGQKTIIGYGKFLLLIEEFKINNKPIWLRPVINFLTEFKTEKDFRMNRFNNLFKNLKELIKCLDMEYYKDRVEKWIG